MTEVYRPNFALENINLEMGQLEGTLTVADGTEDEISIPMSDEKYARLHDVTDAIIKEYLADLRSDIAVDAAG